MSEYDPVQDMKQAEKAVVVEFDKLQQKARDWVEKTTRDAIGPLGKEGQILPLEFYPHSKRLGESCKRIPELAYGTGLIKKLVSDMAFTMYVCGGVGLAGPQVGILQRLFVVDWSEDRSAPIACLNPEIIWQSDDLIRESERCLSLPGVKLSIARPAKIGVRFTGGLPAKGFKPGEKIEMELKGWSARIFMHELEHLDGKVMIDHPSTSRIERRLALKASTRIARGEAPKKAKPKKKRKPRPKRH